MSNRVGIIGGGLSGLLSAHFLQKRGFEVSLFEKSSRCGGWVETEGSEFGPIEWGPHSILADKKWNQLFGSLNIEPLPLRPGLQNRFIWKNASLKALPLSPFQFLFSNFFSISTKLKFFTFLFRRNKRFSEDLSIYDFFSSVLPKEMLETVIDPFAGGIYAGDIHKLSAKACFPRFWKAHQDSVCLLSSLWSLAKNSEKKQVVSFKGGLTSLVSKLESSLSKVFLQTSVKNLEKEASGQWLLKTDSGDHQFDFIIIACSSAICSELLGSILSDDQTRYLREIPYIDMSLFQSVWKRPKNFKPGYGALIPSKEQKKLRGSLWPSEMFVREATQKSNTVLTVNFFNGQLSEGQLKEETAFLKKALEVSEEALFSVSRCIPKAIPQFLPGHVEKVQSIRQSLPEGLFLAGNYLDGVGLSSVLETSLSVADRLTEISESKLTGEGAK